MFAKKPLSIFIFSLLGSLLISTIGIKIGIMKELNPLMIFLFSKGILIPWIFGFGIICFIVGINHYISSREEIKDWYNLGYWILALVFLMNFVREALVFMLM